MPHFPINSGNFLDLQSAVFIILVKMKGCVRFSHSPFFSGRGISEWEGVGDEGGGIPGGCSSGTVHKKCTRGRDSNQPVLLPPSRVSLVAPSGI